MRRLGLALLLCWPAAASAAETAAFLKIGVGARPIAMGSAFTAIADDVNAVAWNPAGLAALSRRELGAMHAELFAGLRYDFLGFAAPTRFGALGFGANFLTQTALDGRDAAGLPTGGFAASDRALSLAYANKVPGSWPLGGALRLGGSVKYLQSSIADASAQSFAVDLGALYDLGDRTARGLPFSAGFAVQNLGPGLRFLDETGALPLTLASGLGWRLPMGLVLALDYKYRPYAKASEVGVGTEYSVLPALSLRMGYASAAAPLGLKGAGGGAPGALGGLSGLGAGLGLKARGYTLDYAFTPFGELGNVQRLSLGARF